MDRWSGAVTAFSQADGFLAIDALATAVDVGARADVTLIGAKARLPDLVVMGSHCIGLDAVLSQLAEQGIAARAIAVGSNGRRRGSRARGMRCCSGSSRRSRGLALQRASRQARPFTGARVGADAKSPRVLAGLGRSRLLRPSL